MCSRCIRFVIFNSYRNSRRCILGFLVDRRGKRVVQKVIMFRNSQLQWWFQNFRREVIKSYYSQKIQLEIALYIIFQVILMLGRVKLNVVIEGLSQFLFFRGGRRCLLGFRRTYVRFVRLQGFVCCSQDYIVFGIIKFSIILKLNFG